jgi:hypothetical protein
MPRPGHLLLAFCISALPLVASADAWKRPVGTGFSSTSFTLRRTEQRLVTEFGYYRDFGLSPLFDLGIDLHQQDVQSGHALMFVRLPLSQGPERTRIAAKLALGGNHNNRVWHPMYRLTLSAGRSWPSRQGRFWGNFDLAYEQRGGTSHPMWKLDGSFGFDSTRQVTPLLQIETSLGQDRDFAYAIIPSLRIKLAGFSASEKLGLEDRELTIGLEYRRSNTQSLGLKVALWHRF